MRCLRNLALTAALLAALPALAAEPPQAELRAGIFPAAPPFIVTDRAGRPGGFTIALFRAIAVRLHRPIRFIPGDQAALLAGLDSGALDLLTGPILATPEHASRLLLLEGYAWSEFQFGSHGRGAVAKLADLRGLRVAAQRGSDYAEWASRNAARYGFTYLAMADQAAVFAAVLKGEADISLTGSAALRGQAGITPGLSLPETRTQEAAAVRQGETELRDTLEDALDCLKRDGTVAKLAQSWFGQTTGPEDLENLVMPGYGVPGLAGYDPKPHPISCR